MGILPPLIRAGKDSYGQSFDNGTILRGFISGMSESFSLVTIVFTICSVLLSTRISRDSRILVSAFALANLAFLLNDLIIYRGNLQGHYLANSLVSAWLSAVLFSLALLASLKSLQIRRVFAAFALALSITLTSTLTNEANLVIQKQVVATQSFQSGLDEIERAYFEHNSNANLIFVAQQSWDYESIVSVSRYLHARIPDSKIFLRSLLEPSDPAKSLFSEISYSGSTEWQIEPLSSEDFDAKDICIYSQEKIVNLANDCDLSVVIRWLP